LLAPRPNPVVGPPATFSFELPRATGVRLLLHDAAGRLAAVIADRVFTAGRHDVAWAAHRPDGRRQVSGVYFLTFEAAGIRQTARLVIVR
jgi:hypothetical protein